MTSPFAVADVAHAARPRPPSSDKLPVLMETPSPQPSSPRRASTPHVTVAMVEPSSGAPLHPIAIPLADVHADHPALAELMPAPSTAADVVAVAADLAPPPKRKRKTYNTEEERRQARILKNRRTAEESRLRKLQRMKHLEDLAAKSLVREKDLLLQIRQGKEHIHEATKIETALRNSLQHKDVQLLHKDAQLAQKVAQLVEKTAELAEKATQLADKDEQIARLQHKLHFK